MAIPKKRLIGLIIVVTLAAAGGYVAYDYWKQNHSSPGDIVLYGNIDIREADLAFNVAGRIDKMLVEEGAVVEKGTVLATLEPDTYQAEVDAAKARLNAQNAVLDRLLAGSRPEEIKEARANVQAVESDLEDAKTNLQRTEKLATNQVSSVQKLDLDRSRVKGLEAQLKAAQQRLALAIQGPRKEDIAQARAVLQADQADLALAERRLGYTRLVAKDHGIIKTRITEPGAVVLPQSPVYTIALTDPVWVRTYVSEPDLGRVHPGMKAEVVTNSAPGNAYEGWVGFISPVAEFTPKSVETREVRTSLVYRLRVYVKNPDNRLRQGMPATVRLKPEPGGGKAGEPAAQ